ncbi:MAG: NAD(P)-binding protein, partial [Eubacteriales bacterium]|nr:NAD(P)-binding protein [Eubacteriales bacterium]
MTHVKYLILGAGVSGLAFASRVKDEDYLIIEKEDEAGGYCRTIRSGEYVWDYAGHFFHFSHPELKAAFEEITSSDDTVHRVKETKIYYKGYYVDYPFQKNIHQLTKDEMIDCLYDLFYKVEKDCYDSFEDMLYGKFGNSITEKFLKPY